MRRIVLLLALVLSVPAVAADPPRAALPYLPMLATEIVHYWPDVPLKSALGAQVEQETCVTLTHRKCWNPKAELKTDREYGFGLGQLTVTAKFNAWAEVRGLDASLRSWKWEDRFDPGLQLRALVVKDRFNFDRLAGATPQDRLAFAVAAYNGGLGGVLSDQKLCRATVGCDPGRWFGHVETTSRKSRTKWKGYGESAFDINRGYVRSVLVTRRPRYISSLGD